MKDRIPATIADLDAPLITGDGDPTITLEDGTVIHVNDLEDVLGTDDGDDSSPSGT